MPVTPDLIARGLGALPSQLGRIAAPAFRVYIRDSGFRRVAELTDWTSFTCIPKFNGIGTWTLETSSDSLEATLLEKTGGIIVTREIEGIESVIFSGFVWTEWGYTATTFRASGYSDEALLWEPARPTPGQASPPFPDDYDVRTGVASTVMIDLVSRNIGPLAPTGPKVDFLFMADDPLLGTTITARGNLQPLITMLAELALTPYAGGLGFKLQQDDYYANVVSFSVYAPEDKSADAKFSIELGTAADYEDIASAPDANHVYVMGGDGFGANRTIIEETDTDSITEWGRRISTVVDMRGTTDTGELNQRAAEEIAKVSTLRRTAITPFDVPSLQYGLDYDLGTLVTVVTHGGEVVDLIREVEVNLDPQRGAVITPIVGTGDDTDDGRTATIIRTIQNRVGNIERNWNVPDDSIIRAMLVDVLKPPIGKIEWLAGSSVPTGYLAANGQSVLRSAYPDLYLAIGTTWGSADGSHFNVPDLRDRFAVGSGSSYALGAIGGSATASGLAHTHPGSHSHTVNSHSHTGAPHTHPGSHSHGLADHYHVVHLDHDHPSFDSGQRNNDSVGAFGFNEPASSGGTEDHHHNVNVPAYSADESSGGGKKVSDGTTLSSTDSDSSAPSASFSGDTGTASPSTDSDSNAPAASYSGSTSIVPPYAGLFAVIYAGV